MHAFGDGKEPARRRTRKYISFNFKKKAHHRLFKYFWISLARVTVSYIILRVLSILKNVRNWPERYKKYFILLKLN